MIRFPEIEINESLLPSKKWKLDGQGRWRPFGAEGQELSLPNYPVFAELPQDLPLTPYTDSDYEQHFQSSNWTRQETDFLYDLCSRFALRFPVIQDRFNEKFQQCRSIEDLKERYFEIAKTVQMIHSPNEPTFTYDKEMDLKRKQALEALHARSPDSGAEENFVIDYLAKFQQNGEMQARLSQRIGIIKMLAGEQFTAGWPTLPELLKIASGKGGNRFIDKKKQKKKKRPAEAAAAATAAAASSGDASPQKKKTQTQKPPTKKVKTAPAPALPCNIYLRSSKMQPLRVGSARSVEKILAEFGLPLKPRTPTAAVVEKYDRVRSSIIQLLDARKSASKSDQ